MIFFKDIPDYDNGRIEPCIYNTGCGVEDDQNGLPVINNYTLLVTEASEESYRRYIEKLNGNGYKTVFENRIGSNGYTQLTGKHLLYVYYTASKSEVRIIIDDCSTDLISFNDSSSKREVPVRIVQYGLYYDKNNGHSPTTTNCGMLYMIRLADNSLFMIDGGDILQCSEEAVNGMIDFMRRLTGVSEGEKIRISAWMITHAHNDHFCGAAKLINRFSDILETERLIFNFPSSKVRSPDDKLYIFKKIINEKCPKTKYLKAHTGQIIELGSVKFEVLYAFEDAISSGDPSAYPLRDYNCTSLVVKMYAGDNSVLWLGDTNVETERIVTGIFSPDVWKSDVVQIAHHCFNYLSTLYPMIDADHAMLPNSYFGGHTPENTPKLQEVIDHLQDPCNISYSDRTTGFEFIDGKFTEVINEERIGGEYDFSGF